ncbi:MAG: ABC transporter permease [Methylobacterium sp.]|jgi:peptide/nickel transport system permease protein|nr:ABC transporter permease [Methylobacterium sp.]MCA3602359.1 ABC transporter permease [Methylobacterium sp.]MCA3610936.1 ABC transporter permease [Methylobacterium sp.]MCA3613923.1 ABC transporter permease [Methylobacterium sp.]MCA3622560.1 ABC transporter permease [Methylobacterium sp.]
MGRYITNRIVQLIPVLFLISVIVFGVLHALPGDPAELILQGAEGGAPPERLQELRQAMGLNDPLLVQYFRFLGGALLGDLGESVRFRTPVSGLILDRLGFTIELAVSGLLMALLIGVPLGMIAAVRQNSWIDTAAMGLAYIGASMPIFWFGLVLILLFSFTYPWLPPAGAEGLQSLVLPAFTLGFVSAGPISRLVRSSMIEVLGEDYIRTSRAKGLTERLVLWRHGFRNALIPVVTMVGLIFGGMLAGAVVTETVFSRPGLGRLVVSAILSKDYPLVQGCVLFLAVLYLTVNLLVDILYAWLDPRIRYGN